MLAYYSPSGAVGAGGSSTGLIPLALSKRCVQRRTIIFLHGYDGPRYDDDQPKSARSLWAGLNLKTQPSRLWSR